MREWLGTAPIHNYSNNGTYTICLSISDSTGCMSVFCNPPSYFYKNSSNVSPVTITVINSGPTTVDEFEMKPYNYFLFPNPSSGFVRIESHSKIDSIEVYTLWGEICYASRPNSTFNQFNLDNDGMYFVHITSNGSSDIQKIVIPH